MWRRPLLARFGAHVRTLAPFLAGAAGMRYGHFLPWSIAGCGVWAAALSTLGLLFYRSLDRVGHLVVVAGLSLAAVVVAALVWRVLRRRRLSR